MHTPLRRRLATLATTLGLVSIGFLGTGASPAQAAISDCPKGYFCAWKTYDGTGTMFQTKTDKATLGGWDNTFRAVVNRTSEFACLHDDPNYDQASGAVVWNPDPAATEWGNAGGAVSSLKFVSTARECSLPAHPQWYASTAPRAAGFGDLNADRRADILVRDKAGRLWFLGGDNTGRLVGTGGWNAMSALTRHGDFTGDGREDAIAREASTGRLWLYPGTGSGALGSRELIGTGGWNGMREITAYGDLTGDGRSDLIAAEKSTGRLYLYPGTSTGALGSRKLIGTGGWNGMNALVGMGDTNGDGHPDLYAREAATGKLYLYPGRTGALGGRTLIGTGGWNVMDDLLGVGDVTGDGRADLVTTTNGGYVSPECRGTGCQLVYAGRGTGALERGVVTGTDWWGLNGAF
ncbi:FG-GAP-like repeat-containing protein [Streptomyces pactum]|uniref:ATP/GTP-binding protein n=1 Tax=Streptomyces pactum TaxID=68249 RepID=A0A1S6J9W8_9ACTN|nr:FG-GAP-like repeat-containing protein [Streptomyces pactum]AQS68533.1 ATP/GTP-binding protein [Streptomyces pactum]